MTRSRIRYKNKILISSCDNANYEKKNLGVFEIWIFFLSLGVAIVITIYIIL